MTASGRWRAVRNALAVGAVYDAGFGVAILGFTAPAAERLGLTVPSDPFYLHLNGVFLLLLAALYGVAAIEPERYRLVAPLSAVGRFAGCALFVRAFAAGGPAVFLTLGLLDAALAAGTLAAWLRARGSALSD